MNIPPIAGLAGAAYVGVFEMGITFVLWLKALRLTKTTAQVSTLIYLTPFLSLIIISVVVGEKILASTIAGLLLILSGIILQRYPPRPHLASRP
jgi:drug/metabolite transporter (DMT)-like permease